MTLSNMLFTVATIPAGVFQEGIPISGEPYTIPPLTGLVLSIILTAVLVLALAYNIRAYQPPMNSHHAVDTPNEAPPEHE